MGKVKTFSDLEAVAREGENRTAAMRKVRLQRNLGVISELSADRPEEAKAFIQGLSRIEKADLLEHAPNLATRLTGFHDMNVIAYGARALLASAELSLSPETRSVQQHLTRVSLARVTVPPAMRSDLTKRLKDIDETHGLGDALRLWLGYQARATLRSVGRAFRWIVGPRRR